MQIITSIRVNHHIYANPQELRKISKKGFWMTKCWNLRLEGRQSLDKERVGKEYFKQKSKERGPKVNNVFWNEFL